MKEMAINMLKRMVENAGESGVTEGQAVSRLMNNCELGYYETQNLLRDVYMEAGVERTPAHTGKLIYYRRPKEDLHRMETTAEILAKQSAKRAVSERKTEQVLDSYRRK